jgi:hypothetical protein
MHEIMVNSGSFGKKISCEKGETVSSKDSIPSHDGGHYGVGYFNFSFMFLLFWVYSTIDTEPSKMCIHLKMH